MNAPATAAALAEPTLQLLAIAAIAPSATHIQELRRARFDKKALDELADSIGSVGVLQPPVCRPLGKEKYELVAGERRWLASKIAGLKEIAVNVRALTDEQVLEVQLIENLQREGLHELEEAEGYEELMKLKKINADQVADMVGKSRSYVYARTKLLSLCPEARKKFYAGELDASRALLVARIGHHDTQRQALKDITEGRYHGAGAMSYREAHKHIVDNYMLVLKSAPFDITDANLVPKAGPCGPCPKRTGNQHDLFGDVKNADVCTDPKCFDDKRQALYSVERKALEAKGKTVIYGDAAKKIFQGWDSPNGWARDQLRDNQYAKLDDTTYASGRSRKVSEILGDEYEPVLIQHPGTGKIVKVATQQAITKAAASSKRSTSGSARKTSAGSAGGSSNDKARELADKIQLQTREAIFAAVHAKVATVGAKELLEIVAFFARGEADLPMIGRVWGWKIPQGFGVGERALMKEAAKLPAAKLSKLAFELSVSERDAMEFNDDEHLMAQAKRLKIDAKAIAAQVKVKLTPAAVKPADKPATKKKPAAKSKGKKK